ncbi:MAG TPA: hypothetical protein VGK30_09360 [Candidatus Binatia bacterium]
MTKTILAVVALTISLAGAYPSTAYARVDVHVGIAIPPPPVVTFESEPQVVVVPQTQVYYVPGLDYDFYRFGGWWYVNRDGYWYSSRSYHGPFGPIAFERVPHAIVAIPASYHHHPIHPAHWHGEQHARYHGHDQHVQHEMHHDVHHDGRHEDHDHH